MARRMSAPYSLSRLLRPTLALYSCSLLLLHTPAPYSCSLRLLLTPAPYSCSLLLILTPASSSSSLLLLFTPALYTCSLLLLLSHAPYSCLLLNPASYSCSLILLLTTAPYCCFLLLGRNPGFSLLASPLDPLHLTQLGLTQRNPSIVPRLCDPQKVLDPCQCFFNPQGLFYGLGGTSFAKEVPPNPYSTNLCDSKMKYTQGHASELKST